MHPYYVLTMRKSASAPAPSAPPSFNVSATTMSVSEFGQAMARFTINSDGSCTADRRGSPSAWITPVGGSYGSSYWVIVAITSGAVTTGTVGSRVAVGTGVSWSVSTTGTGVLRQAEAVGTIEIWNAATGGTMVASGSFSLFAEVDLS